MGGLKLKKICFIFGKIRFNKEWPRLWPWSNRKGFEINVENDGAADDNDDDDDNENSPVHKEGVEYFGRGSTARHFHFSCKIFHKINDHNHNHDDNNAVRDGCRSVSHKWVDKWDWDGFRAGWSNEQQCAAKERW